MNRIHCMNRLDPSDDLVDFVRLEMPDEVPPDQFSREFAPFSPELLNVIFAKIVYSGLDSFPDLFAAECLCYCNQSNIMSAPAASRACSRDAHAHFIHIF